MSESLSDFHTSFFNEIRADSDAEGRFLETAFLERYGEWLVDSGEFETFDIAQYRAARGMRVDAYGGDPSELEGVLSLAIADFSADDELQTLTRTDVEATFRRVENFVRASLTDDFRHQLEESSPGYGLAELIHARRTAISRIRLFIVSNRELSSRYDGTETGTIDRYPVTYNVWDISRLHRLVASGKGKEDIEIDFQRDFGELLPCLPAHVGQDEYEAYLAVIPAELLSRIYEKWGARLLEQNVRSFLQARGNVNKGIRGTLLSDPGMFFAYNNGITATAEDVETSTEGSTVWIRSLRNLQIVNGGQTTASIFSARKKDKADLSRVFVQMKLSVVLPERAIEVVPRISEYANSQNRVNAADFFANHPFHVRLEEFSRRIWAPAADGSFRQSKWFYERARGQYLDAKAYLTPARKKAYEEEFPKAQSFTKTDLAKYEMVWEERPYIVSRGAQHNFADYARLIGSRWAKDQDQVNELYFRTVVARAIIFRSLEKLITAQPWYDGGYRAQMVAYTIAKLDQIAKGMSRTVDFEAVWKAQALPPALERAVVRIADTIRHVVTQPDPGTANVGEWAKKQACWARVQAVAVDLPDDFESCLVDASARKEARADAKKVQKIDNGIDAQMKVMQLGAPFWAGAQAYATRHKLLTPTDHGLLSVASRPGGLPSEKQSLRLLECLEKLKVEGYADPALTP